MKISKYSKGGMVAKKKKTKSDRAGGVKLPNLKSAYLEHPAEGLNMRSMGMKQSVRQAINNNPVKMCGLCGTRHAPGEPHQARKASQFNSKKMGGVFRVGGGYTNPDLQSIKPSLTSKRGSNVSGKTRSISQNNKSQRSLMLQNRLQANNLAGKSQRSGGNSL